MRGSSQQEISPEHPSRPHHGAARHFRRDPAHRGDRPLIVPLFASAPRALLAATGDAMAAAHAGSSAQPAAPAQPNSSAQTATLSPSSLSFVAGAISGAAGQAVGHPLDTLNIHAQAGRSTEHLRLWSLWRGASVPVMTVGSINSLALGVFENVRRALWPHESPTPLPVLAAAGTSCGLAVSVVTCPLSRVKILQQLTGARFFVGVQRCLESRSLFRAYPTAAVPTTPNSAPPEPCWPQP